MSTLEKSEPTSSISHITRFLKSEIPIYNSKVPVRLVEKREEEERMQLQSVMRYTQTQ